DPKVVPEITPLLRIDRVLAVTVTEPAFPMLPKFACELIPVSEPAPVPSIDSLLATRTATLPALPGPEVVLAISPLAKIARLPAVIVTSPARPGPTVGDRIPVLELWLVRPSITAESTITAIDPADPIPKEVRLSNLAVLVRVSR